MASPEGSFLKYFPLYFSGLLPTYQTLVSDGSNTCVYRLEHLPLSRQRFAAVKLSKSNRLSRTLVKLEILMGIHQVVKRPLVPIRIYPSSNQPEFLCILRQRGFWPNMEIECEVINNLWSAFAIMNICCMNYNCHWKSKSIKDYMMFSPFNLFVTINTSIGINMMGSLNTSRVNNSYTRTFRLS